MSRLLCHSQRSWTTSPSSLRAIRKTPIGLPAIPSSRTCGPDRPFDKSGRIFSSTGRSLRARPITTVSHAPCGNASLTPPKLDRHSRFRHGKLYVGVAATGALTLFMLNEKKEVYPVNGLSAVAADASKEAEGAGVESQAYAIPSSSEERLTISYLLQTYILEPISTFFRFLHLALLFGPVILTSPMLLIGSSNSAKGRSPGQGGNAEDVERWGAVWWHGFLVAQMERAGPTFIKLGQWAASRADLFPASLCEQMGKLHSNGDPHSIQHTRRVIENVFGRKFEDIFDSFEEQPIGCGAIAQVYRAHLKPVFLPPSISRDAPIPDDLAKLNTQVAIKILHPRVHKTIRRDIAIMSIFANMINLFPGMQWISLPEEVTVFGEMMESQLDLRVEANNLDRFRENFAKRGPGIAFPKPFGLSESAKRGTRGEDAAQILIEEYEDALPMKYFLRNGGGEFDDRIAKMGLDAFLNMLLIDNWTHGDLHPGNIMVRFRKPSTQDFVQHLAYRMFSSKDTKATSATTDETEIVHRLRAVSHDTDAWLAELEHLAEHKYEPELIFIDAGLVTTLNTENRRNFLDLFQAVAEFDGYRAGHLMVERCRTPELAVDPETFALKMQHIVLSVKSKTFSLAAIKISDVLTDVLKSVRQHHVKMEGDFVNTVISILLLEGIGRQLDPNLDLFKAALPILRQLGRQIRNSDAISQVPKGDLWAMAKIWIWLEARDLAGSSSVNNMNDWIKYDRLMPNI